MLLAILSVSYVLSAAVAAWSAVLAALWLGYGSRGGCFAFVLCTLVWTLNTFVLNRCADLVAKGDRQ